jgi:hypothetical protein
VAAALLVAVEGAFTWVAAYVAALTMISIVALLRMPDTAPGLLGAASTQDRTGRGDKEDS